MLHDIVVNCIEIYDPAPDCFQTSHPARVLKRLPTPALETSDMPESSPLTLVMR